MTIEATELRMYLGERIPNNGQEEDTLFTEDEIQTIITRGDGHFYLTLAHGWNAKAGILADLINITEDGSVRELSRRYQQAARQAESYYKLAVTEDESLASQVPPVVGKGFDAFPPRQPTDSYVFHHTPTTWP